MSLPLPPVPESLRALARKQLAAEPVLRIHSYRKHLRDMAEYAKRMQEAIMVRQKAPGGNAHVDGGWANAGEWSLLLGEYDKAINALRAAWQKQKDTDPGVQQVLATWRQRHNIAPDMLFTEDSEEFWLLLMPEVSAVRGNAYELAEAAVATWEQVVLRYLQMLQKTKPIDGPMLKAGLLDDCRVLKRTDRLPDINAAAA